eukprot:5499573-Amphidinium_carterae.2
MSRTICQKDTQTHNKYIEPAAKAMVKPPPNSNRHRGLHFFKQHHQQQQTRQPMHKTTKTTEEAHQKYNDHLSTNCGGGRSNHQYIKQNTPDCGIFKCRHGALRRVYAIGTTINGAIYVRNILQDVNTSTSTSTSATIN